MKVVKSIVKILSLFVVYPVTAYCVVSECDLFKCPQYCLNASITTLKDYQFKEDVFLKKYISNATDNPLKLKIEITEKNNKIFLIRFVHTTSREISSWDKFEKFKNKIKSTRDESEWKTKKQVVMMVLIMSLKTLI